MGISPHVGEWGAGIPCTTLQREGGCTPSIQVLDQELGLLPVQLGRLSRKRWVVAEPLHTLGSSPLNCPSCVLSPPMPGSCYLGRASSWFLGMGKRHFGMEVSCVCWHDTNTHRGLGKQPRLIQQHCGLFSLFC